HVQLQLLEFLDGVLNRRVDVAAAQTFVRNAVNKKAVEVFAKPVDYRVVAVFEVHACDVDRAWRQLDQVINVAAVQRQVGDLRGRHGGCQLRIFCIDGRGFARHFHYFAGLAELHLEVGVLSAARVQSEVVIGRRLEARGLYGDLVGARRQLASGVVAGLIGRSRDRKVGPDVGDC